ncbi:hypothetical protein Kpol_2000p75 [Vanderwaltozyma polyspora DSM 70294]|uniref:Kinetochore protein SPC25 n=1 Tax=Vanderwaltozyma polyspora (strain ATCC 22028 / DSM 70294 / BCRC 21397 / CBS 2163 / NBRC 10782 / NRRL Y-8283 / UCD 57-17) TaxID=436907 RepID=A7TF82_VANPO|nr:uncharacterized protein Kpol_2000p75 [Vanderwaltozyma polyspora DSM 70294]EDO19107.1 hypothetical protein Kpol_2000p75 [Vanderwaltozyma polyspora DSM 70294]
MSRGLEDFERLKGEMIEFTEKVDKHLEDRKRTVKDVVDSHKREIEQLVEQNEKLVIHLESLLKEQSSLKHEISTYESSTDEVKTKMKMAQVRKEQIEKELKTLMNESKELDRMLEQKQQEIAKRKEFLSQQIQKDNPEVKIYEKLLGMNIDATKPSTLRFSFNNVLETGSNGLNILQIILDISGDQYKVVESSPQLTPNATETLETQLNNTNDIPRFLTNARSLLLEASSSTSHQE